jgi:hypothetical protein
MIAARTIENWLALFIRRSMLCVHFALGAVALGLIRPDETYDPGAYSKQSHYTSRVHEIGLHSTEEGEFELV